MGYGSVPVGVPQQEPSPQELGGRRGGPHRAGPTARRTLATRDQRPRASVGTHGRRAAALAGTAEVRQQGQWVRAAAELPILRSVPGPPWHPPHTEGRRDRQTEVWGADGEGQREEENGARTQPGALAPRGRHSSRGGGLPPRARGAGTNHPRNGRSAGPRTTHAVNAPAGGARGEHGLVGAGRGQWLTSQPPSRGHA